MPGLNAGRYLYESLVVAGHPACLGSTPAGTYMSHWWWQEGQNGSCDSTSVGKGVHNTWTQMFEVLAINLCYIQFIICVGNLQSLCTVFCYICR